jgi:hypothetical protein
VLTGLTKQYCVLRTALVVVNELSSYRVELSERSCARYSPGSAPRPWGCDIAVITRRVGVASRIRPAPQRTGVPGSGNAMAELRLDATAAFSSRMVAPDGGTIRIIHAETKAGG